MKLQWKKTAIAVALAGLFLSTSGVVSANDSVNTVDLNEIFATAPTEKVTVEEKLVVIPFIPTGYVANNIFALSMAIEIVSNPRAKIVLQQNIDRAIAKWKEQQVAEKALVAQEDKKEKVTKKTEKEQGKSKKKEAIAAKKAEKKAWIKAKKEEKKKSKKERDKKHKNKKHRNKEKEKMEKNKD